MSFWSMVPRGSHAAFLAIVPKSDAENPSVSLAIFFTSLLDILWQTSLRIALMTFSLAFSLGVPR
jgi:hypothetical protein